MSAGFAGPLPTRSPSTASRDRPSEPSCAGTQTASIAAPPHAAVAALLADRLDRFPTDGGIGALEPVVAEVVEGESAAIPAGTAVPAHLAAKTARALEAPVDELVARGVIRSAELLAAVLPQITAGIMAADIADPRAERGSTGQTYAAFRRRRSLLLLDLASQVRFEELPWAGAGAAAHRQRGRRRGGAPHAGRGHDAHPARVRAHHHAQRAGHRAVEPGPQGRSGPAAGARGGGGHLHGPVHRHLAEGRGRRRHVPGRHALPALLRPATGRENWRRRRGAGRRQGPQVRPEVAAAEVQRSCEERERGARATGAVASSPPTARSSSRARS